MKNSSYVFGAAMLGTLAGGFFHQAEGATSAVFTFESNAGVLSSSGTATFSTFSVASGSSPAFAADSGSGSAFGFHAGASTYSPPSGNGGGHSFSSNNFAVGDYYQFNVPTTTLTSVSVSFDQAGSGTGPAHFALYYSLDGTNFSSAVSYTVYGSSTAQATGTNSTTTTMSAIGFGSTSNANFNRSFDLSSISGLSGDSLAAFRLVDLDTVSLNLGTVASGGTDRVDNFTVSDTPEPASLGILAVAGVSLLARRRND